MKAHKKIHSKHVCDNCDETFKFKDILKNIN